MSQPITSLTANPLASDSEKNSLSFGLQAVKSAYNRWLNGYGIESNQQRVNRFNRNRRYAMGKQDTKQYMDIVNTDGQIAVLNIDYSPLPIAVPFINRLIDKFVQRIEKIRCSAVDPFSQDKKREAKETQRFKIQYGDRIKALQEQSGMELENFSETDPKDEQELDIWAGFSYKMREEVIMELGLDMVNYENNWDDVIKPRLLWDIVCCGYGVTYTEINGNGRIQDVIVKPEDFITSYSDYDDFHDTTYQGFRRFMSIIEVRLRFSNKFSEQELFEMAQRNSGQWGNAQFDYEFSSVTSLAKPWDKFVIPVVDMHYKAVYNLTYERKDNSQGIIKSLKRADGTDMAKAYEKSKPYEVYYHGMWVIGTDIMLKWELSDNMIKPNENLTDVISPFSVYMYNNNKCTNTPLIEGMIPSIDLMHNLHYKTLQIIGATAPDGADIDVSRLSDIDMGQGVGVVNPLQLYSIYLQTGNRYFVGTNEAGDNDGRPPVTPNQFQYSNKLEQLDNKWNTEYSKLQQMTGTSNLDAGFITNQATANSTLDNAKQIATSASNYIYNAYLNIFKKNAKIKQILLWDILVFSNGKFEGYGKALGSNNIEYLRLEATDDFEKTNFDTKIEAVVDDAEQNRLNARINLALETQQISLQDAIELDLIENPRYKAVMLASRSKRKVEQDRKTAMENSKQNTEQQTAAANAKGQQDQVLAQMQFEHQKALQAMQDSSAEQREVFKFAGILKTKIVDAILAKPGATFRDVPDFIWDGLNVTTDAQKQTMFLAMQELAQQQQILQQQAQSEYMQGQQQPEMKEEPPIEQQEQLNNVA